MGAAAERHDAERADLIRDARRRLGMPREELAAALGVVPDTIGRWERGQSRPQPRHLRQLAELLHLPVDILSAIDDQENVIAMPGMTAPHVHDQAAMQRQRLVEVLLAGLESGHATSAAWTEVAHAAADALGVPWPATAKE